MQNYMDSLLKIAKDYGMPDDISENSIAFADTVSSVILNWSKQDKYAESRSASRYSVSDTPAAGCLRRRLMLLLWNRIGI